jgi:pimeloyl-ACP methyl ester carboxylesterase
MKQLRTPLILTILIILTVTSATRAQQSQPTLQIVDLKSADGIVLKATYFPAAKPGPGILLFHQSNRTRTSWNDLARQLAAAGINTLALDTRGYGESGGTRREATQPEKQQADLETAFRFLVSQPGVLRDVIGSAGTGWLGVDNSVQIARLHPNSIKSLVLMSGETLRPGIEFLHQTPQLPELFVVADSDEYPPTVEAMLLLYARSSSPTRKLIHYSGEHDAPWLWYETSDASKVPATGSHGTDLFKTYPDLPDTIMQWLVTTLIKTPGHAPADPLAAAVIVNQLEMPDGIAQVTRQFTEARRTDPYAQLWPEISLDIIGSDHMRLAEVERTAGQTSESQAERKLGIEIFKLNLLAYPDSADAHFNLADAYLQDGQKALARQLAEEALAMIDSHKAPLSSWSDTEQRRAEIRNGVQDILKKLNAAR